MAKRSILITGTSSGIGHHAAHALTERGWQVVAAVRNRDDMARLADEGLETVHIDYSDETSIHEGLAAALRLTDGRLDALFNNGAYGQVGALEDISTAQLRAQFEANLFGWHTLTQAVLPVMRTQGSGRIVQCSSVLGFVGTPYRGPYVSSKFALEGYTDSLRAEVAPFGIQVVSLQPGPITSQFRANALAMFEGTVSVEGSAYARDYAHQLERLRSRDKASFELGPEAVTAALIKALECGRPRTVYRITTPTHIFALARRILPTSTLHALLAKGRRQ